MSSITRIDSLNLPTGMTLIGNEERNVAGDYFINSLIYSIMTSDEFIQNLSCENPDFSVASSRFTYRRHSGHEKDESLTIVNRIRNSILPLNINMEIDGFNVEATEDGGVHEVEFNLRYRFVANPEGVNAERVNNYINLIELLRNSMNGCYYYDGIPQGLNFVYNVKKLRTPEVQALVNGLDICFMPADYTKEGLEALDRRFSVELLALPAHCESYKTEIDDAVRLAMLNEEEALRNQIRTRYVNGENRR